MRSTAIRWNFREYRFRFTLQFLSLQSVPLGTVSIQGFSPFFPLTALSFDDPERSMTVMGISSQLE